MAKRKSGGGIFGKIFIGKEKDEGFARASLPSSRTQLFFDIFKGNFKKLFYINVLTAIFFVPLFFVLLIYNSRISLEAGTYPFSQNIGVGYPAMPNFTGLAEAIRINATTSLLTYLMPLGFFLAGLGMAGGMYVIRNMVYTEGVFVATDFWRGICKNFFSVVGSMLLFGSLYFLIHFGLVGIDYSLAMGMGTPWLLTTGKVGLYILAGFLTIVLFYMMALGVTYQLKFHHLFKNALILTLTLLPKNILFLALALAPALLYVLGKLSSLITIIFYMVMLIIGFAYAMLLWTDYVQGVFDKYINVKMGAKTNRGIYQKVTDSKADTLKQYKGMVGKRSEYEKRPIKPLEDDDSLTLAELPETFTLKDLEVLQESKQRIYDDHAAYVKEHEGDERYQLTEEEKAIEQAEKKELEKIEKAYKKNSHISNPLFAPNKKKKRK